jgi:hypothetical protein
MMDLLSPSVSTMIGGMLLWILWLCLSLAAFLYFVRGMRALTEIPRRLERIEQLLVSDQAARRERSP